MESPEPAVWFPAIRAGTGADVFTERLVEGLQKHGFRAEITWLPLRAEYAPWSVPIPQPPAWANVVHVNTWLHSRFLPRKMPVVATIHHSMHAPALRRYKGAARAAYHRLWIAPNERRVLLHARRIVAVSRFVAETAKQTLLDLPMEVIYNGVDTHRFRPGNRDRLSGEPFRLVYVGAWKPLKGVDLFAPIMRELSEGFELRYTGGPAAAGDKQGMPPNMVDIGRLNGDQAVAAAMQDADALLFPSRSEGLPLVVAEALACGLPVIGTHDTAVAEAIRDGDSGVLCRPNSIDDFAAAARWMNGVEGRRQVMQSAARRRAVESFSLVSMLNEYVRIYRELLCGMEAGDGF